MTKVLNDRVEIEIMNDKLEFRDLQLNLKGGDISSIFGFFMQNFKTYLQEYLNSQIATTVKQTLQRTINNFIDEMPLLMQAEDRNPMYVSTRLRGIGYAISRDAWTFFLDGTYVL